MNTAYKLICIKGPVEGCEVSTKQKTVWKRLSQVKSKIAWSGFVFRCYFEDQDVWIDLILTINYDSPSNYSLMRASGLKAGTIYANLPIEAKLQPNNRYEVSMSWLKNNCDKWIGRVSSKNIFYLPTFVLQKNWQFEQSSYDNVPTPWKKLSNLQEKTMSAGAVFRCPAKWPYEEWVDFMLIEDSRELSGYAIMVISGYKSGLIRLTSAISKDAILADAKGILVSCVIENWKKWIYEKGLKNVFYLERFDVDSNWSLECVTEEFVSMNRDIKI